MSRVGRKGSDNKYALVHQQSKQAKDRGGEAFVLSHGTEGHALTFNLKKGLFTEGTGRLFPVEGLLTSLNLDVFFCFFGKREKQARPQSTRNSAGRKESRRAASKGRHLRTNRVTVQSPFGQA